MNKRFFKFIATLKLTVPLALFLCIAKVDQSYGADTVPAGQAQTVVASNAGSSPANTTTLTPVNKRIMTIAGLYSPVGTIAPSKLQVAGGEALFLSVGTAGPNSVGLAASSAAKVINVSNVGQVGTGDFDTSLYISFADGQKTKYLSVEKGGLIFSDTNNVSWIPVLTGKNEFLFVSKSTDPAKSADLSGYAIVRGTGGSLALKKSDSVIAPTEKVSFKIPVSQSGSEADKSVSNVDLQIKQSEVSSGGVSAFSVDVNTGSSKESQATIDARFAKYIQIIQQPISRIRYKDSENNDAFFEKDVAKILLIGAGVNVYPSSYDSLAPALDGEVGKTAEILLKFDEMDPSKAAPADTPNYVGIKYLGLYTNLDSTLAIAQELYKTCILPSVAAQLVITPALANLIGAIITKLYEGVQIPLNSNGELESNTKYKDPAETPDSPTSLTGIRDFLANKFKFKSTSSAANFDAYLTAVNSFDSEPDDQKFIIDKIGDKDYTISKAEAQIILLATVCKILITKNTLDPEATEITDLAKIDPASITSKALLNLLKGTAFVKSSASTTTQSSASVAKYVLGKIPYGLINMDTKLKLVSKLSDILNIEKNPDIVNSINVGRPGIGSTVRAIVMKLYNDSDLRRYKDASGKAPVVDLKTFVDANFQYKVITNFYDELKDLDQQFIGVKSSENAKAWIANLEKDFTKRLESLAKDPCSDNQGQNQISQYIQDFSNASIVAPLIFLRYKTTNIQQIAAYSIFNSTILDSKKKAIDRAYELSYELMKDLTFQEAVDYVKQMFQGSGSLSDVQSNIFKNVLISLCASGKMPEANDTTRTYVDPVGSIQGRLGFRLSEISNFKNLIKQYEDLTNGGKAVEDTDSNSQFGKCVKVIKDCKMKVFEAEFLPLVINTIHNCCLKDSASLVWDKVPPAIKKPSIHQLSPMFNYDLATFWDDFYTFGYKDWEKMKLVDWTKPEHFEPVNAILNFVCDCVESLAPADQEKLANVKAQAVAEITRIGGVRNIVKPVVSTPITSMTLQQMLDRMQGITNKICVSAQDITDYLAIVAILSAPEKYKDLTTAQKDVYTVSLSRAKNNQVFKASLDNKIQERKVVAGSPAASMTWNDIQAKLGGSSGGVKIAVLWTDPSDASKQYVLKLLSLGVAPAATDKEVRFISDDYLDSSCHFEFITVEQNASGEINYIRKDGKYLVVPQNGIGVSLEDSLPTADSNPDRAKFLKVKVSDSLRAFQNRFTGGFLTVRQEAADKQKAAIEIKYPGKKYCSLTTKIGDSPAGQTNSDGTISPTNMSGFTFVSISKLHQDLLAIKNDYKSIADVEANVAAKNTKFVTTVAQFVQLLTDLQSTNQTNAQNLILVASIFKSFIDLCVRQTTSQWKWFITTKDTDGQSFSQISAKVYSVIEKLSASDAQVKPMLDSLKASLTNPVTQSDKETALLPENNSIINFSVQIGGATKYLKTYQERSADGNTVIFVKADCDDPLDPDAQFKFVINDGKCVFYKNGTQLVLTSSPTTINPKWNMTTIKQQERVKLLPLDQKLQAQQMFAFEPDSLGDFANVSFFLTNLSEVGGTWQVDPTAYICSMVHNPATSSLDPIAKDPTKPLQKFKYQVTSKLVSQLDAKDPMAAITSLVAMVQDVAGTDNKEVVLSNVLNTAQKFMQKLQSDLQAWAGIIGNNQILAQFESFFALAAATIRKGDGTTPLSDVIKKQFRSTLNLYLGIKYDDTLGATAAMSDTFDKSTISWVNPSGQKIYLGTVVDSKGVASFKFSPDVNSSDETGQFSLNITQTDPCSKDVPTELKITIVNNVASGNTVVSQNLVVLPDANGEQALTLATTPGTEFTTNGPVLNLIINAKKGPSDQTCGFLEVDPQTAIAYANDSVDKNAAIPLVRASHFIVEKLSALKIDLLKYRVKDKAVGQDVIKIAIAALTRAFTKTAPGTQELDLTYYEFDRLLNLFLVGTVADGKEEALFNSFKANNNDSVNYLFQSFERIYNVYMANDKDLYTKKLATLAALKTKWSFGFRIETPGVLKTGDKILLQSLLNNKFVVAQDSTIEKIPVFYTDANVEDPISAAQFEVVELNGRYALRITKDGNPYVLSTKLSALLASNKNAIEAYKKQLSRAILVPQPKGWALESNTSALEQFSIYQNSDNSISLRAVYSQDSKGILQNPVNSGFLTTTSEDEDQGFLRANEWTDGTMIKQTNGLDQKFKIILLTAQTAEVFAQLTAASQKTDPAEKMAIYKSLVSIATTSETVALLVQEVKKMIKENMKIDEKTWVSFVQTFSDQIQSMAKDLDQRLPGNKIFDGINLLLQQQYQDDNNGNFAIKVVFDDGKERFLKFVNQDPTADVLRLVVCATGNDKIDPAGSFTTKIEGIAETGQLLSIQARNGVDAVINSLYGKKVNADCAFLAIEISKDDCQFVTVQPDSLNKLNPLKKFTFIPVSGRKFNISVANVPLVVDQDYNLCFGQPNNPLPNKVVNLEFVPLTSTEAEFARIEGLPIESSISEFTRRIKVVTPKSKPVDQQLLLERVAKFVQRLVADEDTQEKTAAKKAIVKTRENDIIKMLTALGAALGDKFKDQVSKVVQVWNMQTDGPKNGDVVLIRSVTNNKYLRLMQDPQTKVFYLQAGTDDQSQSDDPVVATRFTVGRNMSTLWFSVKDSSGKEAFLQTNTPNLTGINIPSVLKTNSRLSFGVDQALIKFQLNSEGLDASGNNTFTLKGMATKDKMGNLSDLGNDGYVTVDPTDLYYLRLFYNSGATPSTPATCTAIPKDLTKQKFSFVTVYGTTADVLDQIAQLRTKPEVNDQLTIISGLVDKVMVLNDGQLLVCEVESIISKQSKAGTATWQKFKDYSKDLLTEIATKYDKKFQTETQKAWTNLLSQPAAQADRPSVLPDDQEIVILSTKNNKLLRVNKQSVVKNDYLFISADADDMTQATIFKTVRLSIDDGKGTSNSIKDYYGFMSEDDLASGQFITNVMIDKATDLATAKAAFTRLNLVSGTKDAFLKAGDDAKYQQFIVVKSSDGTTYSLKSAYRKSGTSFRPEVNNDPACFVTVDDPLAGFVRVYNPDKTPIVPAADDPATQTFKIFAVDANSSAFLKQLKALVKETGIEKRMTAYIGLIQSANTVILANLLLRHVIAFINSNKNDAVSWKAFVDQGGALTTQFTDAFTKTFGETKGLEPISGITSIMGAPFTKPLGSRKYAIRAIIQNQPSDKWFELTDATESINALGMSTYTKIYSPTLTAREKLLPQCLFEVKVSPDNNSITIYSNYKKADVLANPNAAEKKAYDTLSLSDTIMSVVTVGASSTVPAGTASQIMIYPVEGLKFKLKSGLTNGFYFVGTDMDAPAQLNRIQSKFPDQTLCSQELATVFEFVELSDQEVATIGIRSQSLSQRIREYVDTVSKIDMTTAKDLREGTITEIENLVSQIAADDLLKKDAVTYYSQIDSLITMLCDEKKVSTYKAVKDRTLALKDSLQKAMSAGVSAETKVFLINGELPVIPFEIPAGGGVKQTVLKAVAGADIFNEAFLLTTQSNGPLISFILGGEKTLVANVIDQKVFSKYPMAKKQLQTALTFIPTAEMPKTALALFKVVDLIDKTTGVADGRKAFAESTTQSYITYVSTDGLLRIFDPATQTGYVRSEASLEDRSKFAFVICDDFYNNAKLLAVPVTTKGVEGLKDVIAKVQGFKDLLLQTTIDNKGHPRIFLEALKKAFANQGGYALNNGLTDLMAKAIETWNLAQNSTTVVGMKALIAKTAPLGQFYADDLVAMLETGPAKGVTPDSWFSALNKNSLSKWKDCLVVDKAFTSITDAQVIEFINRKNSGGKKLAASDMSNAAIARQVKMSRYEMQAQMLQSVQKALIGLLPKTGETAKIALSAPNAKIVQDTIKALATASGDVLKKRATVK